MLQVGTASAGAFAAPVRRRKQARGGCADHPNLRRFESPKYPGRLVLQVSGHHAGHVCKLSLPFWNDHTWAPGNDNFLVEANPGKAVAETDQGNNIAGAVFTR